MLEQTPLVRRSSSVVSKEGSQLIVAGRGMVTEKGKLVYRLYRALSYGLSPLLYLHLRWRKIRGLEHPVRWGERLGRPSLPRPPGQLIWFHAVSLGFIPFYIFILMHLS